MGRALIIGGGIGGPVAAMALQRADIKAVVYDAGDPAAGDTGPHLTIAPNGLNALTAIGVDGLVVAGGFVTRATDLFSSSGTHVGTISRGGDSVTIRHSRLQRLLQVEACSRGIRFEFNKRIVGAAVVPLGVEARFGDGTEAAGEMLIGCDGVHSVVRRIIDPSAPPPRDLGLLNFHGYTPSIVAGTPGRWQVIFGRRACFGYAVDSSGGTVWFANVRRTPSFAETSPATSHEQWQRLLIGLFEGDAGPAAALIAAGMLDVAAGGTLDLPRLPRWHCGPLIVIGDAAHAVAPAANQGASVAIEDGVLLAKHLRQLPTAPAFEAFERARRRRVERLVAQGARISRYRAPVPAGRLMRDVTLPMLGRYLMSDLARAWIYNHRVDWYAPVVNA